MGERANALHILTNNSGNYIKLHNGLPIGINLKDDLRQYFTLLFMYEYRYDYYKWVKLKVDKDVLDKPNSDFKDIKYDYNAIIPNEIISYIAENAGYNLIEAPHELLDSSKDNDINSMRDDSYKLGKTPYLEVEVDGDSYYYIPKIVANDNYKEMAIIKSDLEKLDLLFKTSNYSSIDDLVLLDFYKEFKYKIEKLKNKIVEGDDDVKESIEKDILDKLKSLYKIKVKDDKLSKKIEEKIKKRIKDKEYQNFIDSGELKGGASEPNPSLIFNSINKIKEKTSELDEIDMNILRYISVSTARDKDSKYSIKSSFYKGKSTGRGSGSGNGRGSSSSSISSSSSGQSSSGSDNNSDDEKSRERSETSKIGDYNYLSDDNKSIAEVVNDNSIKNNIKYLKIINYLSELKKYNSSGGRAYNEEDNNKKLLNELTNIYNELKQVYINIIREYIKFNNNFKNTGTKYIEDIRYKNPELKQKDIQLSNNDVNNIGKALRTPNNYDYNAESNDSIFKKLSVVKIEFEEELKKLEKFYLEIKNIEDTISANLKKLYSALVNLKEAVYSTAVYTDLINIIITIYNLKHIDESVILIELKKKKDNIKTKIADLNSFKDLTEKKYAELKKGNSSSSSSYELDDLTSILGNDLLNRSRRQRPTRGGSEEDNNRQIKRSGNNILIDEIRSIEEKYNEIINIYNISNNLTLTELEKLIYQSQDDNTTKLNSELVEIIKMLENTLYNNEDVVNNIRKDSSKDIIDNDIENLKTNKDKLIYQELWEDYTKGIKNKIKSGDESSYFIFINEGEKLKNKLILNDLDPEIILKVNLQDKAVFLLLVFIIRTISVVIIELLIEYNIVKTLHIAIMAYVLLYLFILALFIVFINLDSYKLRIIFNYLNMHINTSNLAIHLILFIIFAFLVIIIIQTDDFINNISDVLDYTYIYDYLFNLKVDKIWNTEFQNNLSPDEKIKLLYRLDIVTMIIFIFTGALVIIL